MIIEISPEEQILAWIEIKTRLDKNITQLAEWKKYNVGTDLSKFEADIETLKSLEEKLSFFKNLKS